MGQLQKSSAQDPWALLSESQKFQKLYNTEFQENRVQRPTTSLTSIKQFLKVFNVVIFLNLEEYYNKCAYILCLYLRIIIYHIHLIFSAPALHFLCWNIWKPLADSVSPHENFSLGFLRTSSFTTTRMLPHRRKLTMAPYDLSNEIHSVFKVNIPFLITPKKGPMTVVKLNLSKKMAKKLSWIKII